MILRHTSISVQSTTRNESLPGQLKCYCSKILPIAYVRKTKRKQCFFREKYAKLMMLTGTCLQKFIWMDDVKTNAHKQIAKILEVQVPAKPSHGNVESVEVFAALPQYFPRASAGA